jgi:hypothetical protein
MSSQATAGLRGIQSIAQGPQQRRQALASSAARRGSTKNQQKAFALSNKHLTTSTANAHDLKYQHNAHSIDDRQQPAGDMSALLPLAPLDDNCAAVLSSHRAACTLPSLADANPLVNDRKPTSQGHTVSFCHAKRSSDPRPLPPSLQGNKHTDANHE